MTRVWEHSKQKGAALLLLLAIADFASDEGTAWPSVTTLAEKIRMDGRYVQRLLAKMVEDGELKIEVNAGRHGCNLFTVLTGVAPAPGGPRARVARKPQGGGPRAVQGVAPAPYEPSVNHQEPPLGADAPSAPPKKEPDPVKELAAVFTQELKLTEDIFPKRDRFTKWWEPLKGMVALADGGAPALLRATIKKMQGDGLTIQGPISCRAVFISLHSQHAAPVVGTRFIEY